LNPVRVGIAPAPEQWPWSSVAHVGARDATRLLDLTEWRNRWFAETWA
jgi:hypothetical protein